MSSADRTAVHDLIRRVCTERDHPARYVLLEELGRIGVDVEADMPVLIELCDHPEPFPRSLAVWEVGKLGPRASAAAAALAECAERAGFVDPRWAAVWALIRLDRAAAPAVPALVRLLDDPEDDMRGVAAKALGVVADPRAVEPLAQALGDPDHLVREEAARSLGALGAAARASVPELRALLADPFGAVRAAAAGAIERLEGAAPEAVEPRPFPPDLLDALGERLREGDARTRAETSWGVGKLGAEGAPLAALVARQLREDTDPDARWGASWCAGRLGRAGAQATVPTLVAAVRNDRDPDVRAQAADALGLIGVAGDGVAAALTGGLVDAGASYLREQSARALGRLGAPTESHAALRGATADVHPMVAAAAREALATRLDGAERVMHPSNA